MIFLPETMAFLKCSAMSLVVIAGESSSAWFQRNLIRSRHTSRTDGKAQATIENG